MKKIIGSTLTVFVIMATAIPADSGLFIGTTGGLSDVVSKLDKKSSTTVGPYTLTVALAGVGTGVVTSSPGGIYCGSVCSASYAANTKVTLTAAANAPYSFTGWSGGGCSGIGACVVTMSAAQSVTANFNNPAGSVAGTWQLSTSAEILSSCSVGIGDIVGSLSLTEDGLGNITGSWTYSSYLISSVTGNIIGSVSAPTGFKITASSSIPPGHGGLGCFEVGITGAGTLTFNCSSGDPATCTLSGTDCCNVPRGALSNASGTITATR